jgi:hypothetical protein
MDTAPWERDRQAARWLRLTAYGYAVAWAVHTGDHLRRGLGTVTVEVAALGSAAAVLQLAAVVAVVRRAPWAPVAAVAIGFPDALGIAAVHLLPHWSAFSDAFPGAHGTGVTGFSWFAAILEIAGALAFGAAGAYAWRSSAALVSLDSRSAPGGAPPRPGDRGRGPGTPAGTSAS